MKFIQGKPRNQWEMYCLDTHVDADNEVRLIDLFVDSLNLSELGFKVDYEENGRPAYHPGALLRLFIYGYLNRIRSSRQLEKECKRNLELMWLMRELQPDHNTIANFRKNNPKAIKQVFRATVQLAKHFDLIGGTLLFFWLRNVDLAIERVRTRVIEGGHYIESEIIRRRYINGIKNLFEIYLPIADEIMIFDNSEGKHDLIAEKTIQSELEVLNKVKFNQLKSYYEKGA